MLVGSNKLPDVIKQLAKTAPWVKVVCVEADFDALVLTEGLPTEQVNAFMATAIEAMGVKVKQLMEEALKDKAPFLESFNEWVEAQKKGAETTETGETGGDGGTGTETGIDPVVLPTTNTEETPAVAETSEVAEVPAATEQAEVQAAPKKTAKKAAKTE
jgi:hypothetical protein